MSTLLYTIATYFTWFLKELSVFSTVIIIIFLLGAGIIIGYFLAVFSTGNKNPYWSRFIGLFKRDLIASYNTVAVQDEENGSYLNSYYIYKTQKNNLHNFLRSGFILFCVQILIITLTNVFFVHNPFASSQENNINIVSIKTPENLNVRREPRPEEIYLFQSQGVKEDVAIQAESLINSFKNPGQTLSLPLGVGQIIQADSLYAIQQKGEKTLSENIKNLFFKPPFISDEPAEIILSVNPYGVIIPQKITGLDKDDKFLFNYKFGAYKASYFLDEEDIAWTFNNNIIRAEVFDIAMVSQTDSGYQRLRLLPDGSMHLYDDHTLIVVLQPVFEHQDETGWRPYILQPARINKQIDKKTITLIYTFDTQEGVDITGVYVFGYDGRQFLRQQTWSISGTKVPVQFKWSVLAAAKTQDTKPAKLENLKKQIGKTPQVYWNDLYLNAGNYSNKKIELSDNGIIIYFQDIQNRPEPIKLEASLITPPLDGITVESADFIPSVSSGGFKLHFSSLTGLIDTYYDSRWQNGSMAIAHNGAPLFAPFFAENINSKLGKLSVVSAKNDEVIIKAQYLAQTDIPAYSLLYAINREGQIRISAEGLPKLAARILLNEQEMVVDNYNTVQTSLILTKPYQVILLPERHQFLLNFSRE